MAKTFPRGRFVWHELNSTDPDAAAAFYTRIVSWKVVPMPQDPTYRIWMAGDKQVGGLMRLPEPARAMGAPSHWLPYVAVPDVDASTRQAVALGARVYLEPKDIGIGKFAVLADPQGATFGIYRAAGEQGGHDGPANMGEFSWHELATSNPEAAWEFYHTMFGWVKTSAMDMGPAGVYQMFGRAGLALGGIYKPAAGGPPPHWLSYARVPNADTVAAQVPKLGGRVVNGPMDIPGGDRIVVVMDGQGTAFAVHSVNPATAQQPAPAAAKPAAAKASAPAAKKKTAPAPKKKAAPAAKKKAAARPKAKRKPAKAKKAKKPAKRPARRAAPRKRAAKKKGRRR